MPAHSDTTSNTPLAWNIDPASKRIGVSRGTTYRLIKTGQIATVRYGGRQLITEAELQRFLAANERRAFHAGGAA